MNKKKLLTPYQVAALFQCNIEQVRRQYARNARQLRRMATHGPRNGMTKAELTAHAVEFETLAKQ